MKATMNYGCWVLAGLLALPGLAGCGDSDRGEEKSETTEVAVQVAKVIRTTLTVNVEAYGRVEAERAGGGLPGAGARLTPAVPGVVVAVRAKEGETVAGGALLVELDDRLVTAPLEKAEHALEYAEQVSARQGKLKGVGGTSEKVIQEAAQQLAAARADLSAAQAQLALTRITTPIGGTVVRLLVQPGQAVDPATIVAEVVDLTRLVVTASVTPEEAAGISVGNPVRIFADSGENETGAGTVSFVSPQIDPVNGAVLVRVALPSGNGLRPGQTLRLRIASEDSSGRLAVPKESVVTDIDGHSVLAIVEGDKAVQRDVRTGVRDGLLVEVEGEGLKEGDVVVTIGAYGLPRETRIRIVGR